MVIPLHPFPLSPKKITSIDTWVTAFHVLVGVYNSRYPTEAHNLVKYGETVRDLAASPRLGFCHTKHAAGKPVTTTNRGIGKPGQSFHVPRDNCFLKVPQG